MRVITGAARGRRLQTLPGEDVRPTAERVKEAVFSIIQFDIEGRRVLDLFAGSGQLGIEALSRGAARAVFVDAAAEPADMVRRNLNATQLMDNAAVVRSDYRAYLLSCTETFDIAFLDPPYAKGILQDALGMVPRVMSDYGMILCEHPIGEELPQTVEDFERQRTYRYGKTGVTVYRKGGGCT